MTSLLLAVVSSKLFGMFGPHKSPFIVEARPVLGAKGELEAEPGGSWTSNDGFKMGLIEGCVCIFGRVISMLEIDSSTTVDMLGPLEVFFMEVERDLSWNILLAVRSRLFRSEESRPSCAGASAVLSKMAIEVFPTDTLPCSDMAWYESTTIGL